MSLRQMQKAPGARLIDGVLLQQGPRQAYKTDSLKNINSYRKKCAKIKTWSGLTCPPQANPTRFTKQYQAVGARP